MRPTAPPRSPARLRPLAPLLIALLATLGLASAGGLAGRAAAQAPLAVDYLGEWGAPQAVAIEGDRAYVGAGSTLTIFDISDPATPSQLGTLTDQLIADLNNTYQAVAVSGQHLYAALGPDFTFVAIDISDPASPRVVGRLNGVQGNQLIVDGQRAYLIDASPLLAQTRVTAVDISNPSQPTPLPGALIVGNQQGVLQDVDIQGDLALVGEVAGGTAIYDLTEMRAPQRVNLIEGAVRQLDLEGTLAYLYDPRRSMRVVDIADLSAPQLLGTYALSLDDEIYNQLDVAGGLAYLSSGPAMRIVDVSNPAAPALRGRFVFGGEVQSLQARAGLLSAVSEDGWQLIDTAEPSDPAALSFSPQLGWGARLAVEGTRAYSVASDLSGIRLFDLSDAQRLRQLGAEIGRLSRALAAGDGLAFASAATPGYGLAVYRADQAGGLSSISQLNSEPLVRLALAGDLLVGVSTGEASGAGWRLRVFDVSDPAMPRERGSAPLPGIPSALAVAGDTAYALIPTARNSAFDSGSLFAFDLSDPDAPAQRWSFVDDTSGGSVTDIAIDGDLAFLVNGVAMRILDVSGPAGPTARGSYEETTASAIAVRAGIAYLAGGEGLELIDVSNPDAPVGIARSGPAMLDVESVQVVADPCRPGAAFVYTVTPYDARVLRTFYVRPAASPPFGAPCAAEPTATATTTTTATSEPSATTTATATSEPSATTTATATSEPSPSATVTATSEPSPSATATASPSSTSSPEPSATATSSVPPRLGYTIYLPSVRR